MSRTGLRLAAVAVLAAASNSAWGAVTMTASAVAPIPGPSDQYTFVDDATIPGGIFNSQAFSDNNGPPGQTFTTPASVSAALPNFAVTSVSLKGANTGGGNFGNFTPATTWGVRVSEVSGTSLIPVKTFALVPSATGIVGTEWFTWSFTGGDVPTLLPSTLYAFDVFSSEGYLGFDAALGDAAYAGGTAYNSGGGAARVFGNTTGDLASHGYDRTFHVALQPTAVPEPAAGALAILGLAGLRFSRRRA